MTGESVKLLLYKKGIKITDLAEKLGESQQNTSSFLRAQDIKTGVLERIAEATGISIAEFFGIQPSAINTGTNTGNIAGRDINTTSHITELQGVISSQQKTISELSATIAKLVK